MNSNALSGVGTKFYRKANGTYAALAEVNSISGPSMSRETIDVTSLDSDAGYREFISGIRDAGTVSLNMNFTNATYSLMKADFESDTPKDYKIVIPDTAGTTLEFSGLVTELPLAIEVADKISADVTIKVTGKVDLKGGEDSGGGTTTIEPTTTAE